MLKLIAWRVYIMIGMLAVDDSIAADHRQVLTCTECLANRLRTQLLSHSDHHRHAAARGDQR